MVRMIHSIGGGSAQSSSKTATMPTTSNASKRKAFPPNSMSEMRPSAHNKGSATQMPKKLSLNEMLAETGTKPSSPKGAASPQSSPMKAATEIAPPPTLVGVRTKRQIDSYASSPAKQSNLQNIKQKLKHTSKHVPPVSLAEAGNSSDIIKNGKLFHIRLSPEYLTGVLTRQNRNKHKMYCSLNSFAIGFAKTPLSAKMAMSKPIARLGEDSNARHNIVWPTATCEETEKHQRSLYFSVILEESQESLSEAYEKAPGLNPEVVPVLLGVKCEEDVIDLGVANLVVNGDHLESQTIELAVRSTGTGEKKSKRSKRKMALFRHKKKSAPRLPDRDYEYSLASNATLRVRLDVKSGMFKENGAALWNDLNDTINLYDMSTIDGQKMVQKHNIPVDDNRTYSQMEWIEVVTGGKGTTIISSGPVSAFQGEADLASVLSVPDFVGPDSLFGSGSFSESANLLDGNVNFCGHDVKDDSESFCNCVSAQRDSPDGVHHMMSALSEPTMYGGAAFTDTFHRVDYSVISSSFGSSETDCDDDSDRVDDVTGQVVSFEDTRTTEDTRVLLNPDDETYDRVVAAREALLRYAERTGVDVNDILQHPNQFTHKFRSKISISSCSASTSVFSASAGTNSTVS